MVTTGKFDGKRGRGRPREKMLDSLADWMNIGKPSEMIRGMSSRVGWRSLNQPAGMAPEEEEVKRREFFCLIVRETCCRYKTFQKERGQIHEKS